MDYKNKNNDVKVSVVIPVHNTKKYIKKCLEGIVNQTFKDIEIIVINDGSTDGSEIIVNEFCEKDSRIQLINNENHGVSYTRNQGIKKAKGKYILFIDDDDTADKFMIEKMYSKITEEQSQVCVCNVNRVIDGVSNKQFSKHIDLIDLRTMNRGEYIKNYILPSDSHRYAVWCRLYDLDFLRSNNIYFEPDKNVHSEDLNFNLDVILYAQKISTVNEVLYTHILRSGSISTSKKVNISKKLMLIAENFKKKSILENKWQEVEGAFDDIVQYIFYMAMSSEVVRNKLRINEINRVIKNLYNYEFFQSSMLKIGKTKKGKREYISFIVGKKRTFLASMIIYNFLKIKSK